MPRLRSRCCCDSQGCSEKRRRRFHGLKCEADSHQCLAWESDEKSGTVFAKNVSPNGLGKKAGFQVGDVILAINGSKPKTMLEAVDMLSRLPIGDEAVFTVQRADKMLELRVVAE